MAFLGQLNGNSLQGIYATSNPSINTPTALAVTGAAAPNAGTNVDLY